MINNVIETNYTAFYNFIDISFFDLFKKANVDVICVHCPSCFLQFDTKQKDLQKEFGIKYNLPVLYLTELLALSMGFDLKDYGMKYHRIRLNI